MNVPDNPIPPHADACETADSDALLVYACSGRSAAARLANDVALRLDMLGVADMNSVVAVGGDVASAVSAVGSGRRMLAINGCSSRCCERVLESHGADNMQSIVLDDENLCASTPEREADPDTDAVVERVLGQLGIDYAMQPRRPASRRPTPSPTNAADRYLRSIWMLASPTAGCDEDVDELPVRAAEIARYHGVSRVTAGEAVARLERDGLIRRGSDKHIELTADGRTRAESALRRTRAVERFLVDILGCEPADAPELSATLGTNLADELIEPLSSLTGHATRSPQGWPIDPVADRQERRSLVPLTCVEAGAAVTIARIDGRDARHLRDLERYGIVPDARVTVEESSHDAVVRVEGSSSPAVIRFAERVLVRVHGSNEPV